MHLFTSLLNIFEGFFHTHNFLHGHFISGSATYEEAIRDVKLLFAEGVCCPPSIDLKAEEVCQ